MLAPFLSVCHLGDRDHPHSSTAAAAAAANSGTDFTLKITTGGCMPDHLHVSTLFVVKEAAGLRQG